MVENGMATFGRFAGVSVRSFIYLGEVRFPAEALKHRLSA